MFCIGVHFKWFGEGWELQHKSKWKKFFNFSNIFCCYICQSNDNSFFRRSMSGLATIEKSFINYPNKLANLQMDLIPLAMARLCHSLMVWTFVIRPYAFLRQYISQKVHFQPYKFNFHFVGIRLIILKLLQNIFQVLGMFFYQLKVN